MNLLNSLILILFAVTLLSCNKQNDKVTTSIEQHYWPSVDYKNDQAKFYDSLISVKYGRDTCVPMLSMLMCDPSLPASFIKIFENNSDRSISISITEFDLSQNKDYISNHAILQFFHKNKFSPQIAYLMEQLDSLDKQTRIQYSEINPDIIYFKTSFNGIERESTLDYEKVRRENEVIYKNLLTCIMLLTTNKLYRSIYEYYIFTDEQIHLVE